MQPRGKRHDDALVARPDPEQGKGVVLPLSDWLQPIGAREPEGKLRIGGPLARPLARSNRGPLRSPAAPSGRVRDSTREDRGAHESDALSASDAARNLC